MHYRSFGDLGRTLATNIYRLPDDIDLIVGIPRSGMLAGTMLSLLMNIRLTDLDSFIEGRLMSTGSTKSADGIVTSIDETRHVLVIDDSLNRGYAMREAKERLAPLLTGLRATYCAVYGVPDAIGEVDCILETVPLPRLFEWNFLHHPYLPRACVDIDGVLCHDPAAEENDDGARYLEFLLTARPLYRASRPIGCLVTSRLEKYRAETEAWLARNKIAYNELVMLDVASAAERRRLNLHGEFKGKVYRDRDAVLFIESEHRQAIDIARISGKPVLSIEGQGMVHPSRLSLVGAMQSIRNLRVNAEISHSPLVNREALKRRVRRIFPPQVWGVAKKAREAIRT